MKFYPNDDQPKQLEGDETENSIDFFKQLIKQILSNIKVKVVNVCVQLFMNTPSTGNIVKPQYFIMLRVPSILFERFTDKELGKATE